MLFYLKNRNVKANKDGAQTTSTISIMMLMFFFWSGAYLPDLDMLVLCSGVVVHGVTLMWGKPR